MDLSKIFTPSAIAANFNETIAGQQPYLGAALFPSVKKSGLDLAFIKGQRGLPISLAPSTFDAKAKFRDRIGVTKLETEMPFFREGYLIKEKDRQEILRARDARDPYAQTVIDFIYNDVRDLISGANVVPERMIWQLLAPTDGKPKIAISENDVDYAYNYDPNNEFYSNNYTAITGDGKWSDPTKSDPIGDLRNMQDKIEILSGNRPTRAVMSRKTFNYILKSASVKGAILAQNSTANIIMTEPIVKSVISQLLGLSISVYTTRYRDQDKETHQFYPDDMVTLLPEGTIGRTFYGTTPEEADAAGGSYETYTVNTGVSITTIHHPHPVNIEMLASEIVLPSAERLNEVGLIKIA